MREFRGRWRVKNLHAENIKVYEDPRRDRSKNIIKRYKNDSNIIRGYFEEAPDMAGFFTIAWDWKGQRSLSWMCASDGAISLRLLPSWLKDQMVEEIGVIRMQEELSEYE